MTGVPMERWPPSYDADELAASISKLVDSTNFASDFYEYRNISGNRVCAQGDIISFNSGLPLIHDDGIPAILDEYRFWLIVGNTCDISRAEVPYSQIVPLESLGPEKSIKPETIDIFRKYKYNRRFYIPPWNSSIEDLYYADFTKQATIHKGALYNHTGVIISLSQKGWILLNCCLVRFLARDDGRYG